MERQGLGWIAWLTFLYPQDYHQTTSPNSQTDEKEQIEEGRRGVEEKEESRD